MSGWVVVDDSAIANRWRPLTAAESGIAPTLIQDAQDELEQALELIGITGPPAGDERWSRRYVRVVANMVRRLLINPEGVLEEAGDDGYRYRRDKALSTGALYFTSDEFDSLRLKRRRRAFSIIPS